MRHALSRWFSAKEPSGQGLVEYALILVLVVLVVLMVLSVLGPWIGNVFSNVVNNI
ncbi:MAG: pilus assembly protein [Anaerolineae bacterium]|nr:pilus assembly protein [Anaerolineae bacterium]